MSADPICVALVIPFRSLADSKTRLGGVLDAEERADLARILLRRTLEAGISAKRVRDVAVVSPDGWARRLAHRMGAAALEDPGRDLNDALRLGREWAVGLRVDALLILPADLAWPSADAIDELVSHATVQAGRVGHAPVVVIVPDRRGHGTNALLLLPPNAIEFQFGEGSYQKHAMAGIAAGATVVRVGGTLWHDVDTPEDYLIAEPVVLEVLRGGRPNPASGRELADPRSLGTDDHAGRAR